jgi:2-polyprenyl-3-methyl-5-hydroxy-6-metoxy-1,4-benzoquinol methylase
LPISDKSFDKVVLLAVLEHLNNFEFILKEGFRVLKDNGLLLITTPTPRAKKVLDLLAKLKIVNPETIHQHKTYFSHDHLREILIKSGFKNQKIKINYFEFGFNIFCMAQK